MEANRFDVSTVEGYTRATAHLAGRMEELSSGSQALNLADLSSMLRENVRKIRNDRFNISVIGEFKRGKSTIINALLGAEICPADRLPATAALNRVVYGESPAVVVHFKDGKSEEVDMDHLRAYVTKLDEASRGMAETVSEVVVRYPLSYCKNNVDIIDTPGLNDEDTMTEITLSMLPKTDAALFVLMATSPFSETERDFLVNKMIASDLGRVIFVVNAIDVLDEDEARDVLEFIAGRIQEMVVGKAKRLYGADSEEYQKFLRAIGKPRVVGISARNALRGKLRNNPSLVEESNFSELERSIEYTLTQERGGIALYTYLGRMQSAVDTMLGAIEMRRRQFSADKDVFQKKYDEGVAVLEELKKKRDRELENVDVSAKNACQELLPRIQEYIDELKKSVTAALEGVKLSKDDLSKENKEATSKRLIGIVEDVSKNCSVEYVQRLQSAIEKCTSTEITRLEGFEGEFLSKLSGIEMSLTTKDPGNTVLSTAIDVAMGMGGGIPGIGAAYLGYRQAGIKGLLLGGGVGGLTAAASFYALNSLIAAAGIALGGPIVIAGTAIVYLFAGKMAMKAVNKFLQPDMSAKFIAKFRDSVLERLTSNEVRREQEKRLKEAVYGAFDGIKERLLSETERMMNSTKATLDAIASDMEGNEEERKETEELFAQVEQSAGEVRKEIAELRGLLAPAGKGEEL
ncbi:MAG: hypothetical protein GX647_09335 [Clostridiales bacterium]|nr:hypothetical protein [Clostridiales bacterium]OPZ69998.1 MAG: Bacterial dynamin-like protein [Firmicutes bacterium ADurb.Bin467]